MSYDGKFSCESSLKRLLARCSGLRSDRKLLALSQKVGAVTAEDIAEAIAEPFLHPNYTIPIVGCFRPLCRLIVDRAVTKLGSVPSLISMSDEESDDIGEDDTRVIDFYMERGRGLRLHEMASLALCRALDLAPFFLRCIINYFRFSPQPFARLELVGFDSQITDKGEKHLLDVIRLTYRFLIMEPQIFSGLWDWTCFLDLMQQTSNVGASLAPRRLINILDIRWCGIQILSTSLKISDRATEDFGLGSDEAFACLLRFEEFCQDTSLEKAGFYLQLVEEDQERFSVGIDNFSQFFDFDYHSLVSSTNLLKIESGIKDVRHKVLRVVPGKPFVMTSTIRRSFEMILMAVGQRWPILLHGPAGSGKTAIINMLAEISGNQVLFIHMADEMDSKMLIGNYVCSNQPGEFRWHPGSLTQAISKGYWVVFEDIDKASIEVQSIILPLLEGSNIFVTGRGEEIDVSENFRMFATISTLKHEVSHEIEGRLSFCTLWRKVLVKIPNNGDMTEIVNAWYPNLNPLTSRLMDTFVIINSHSSNQVGAHACGGSSGAVSRFSLRDLLKWCKRISDLAISVSGFPISVTDCQAIYHEAVETFVAYLPCSPKKLLMMREIAKVWGVPLPETEHDYPPNKPVIQSCRSHLQVGRVALPFTQIPNLPPGRPFVGIRSSLHALERVASSVKYNEPVLLVGETGTGKTTLVQNLAMRLGQQLTVLNLSQQSDIADLLGGYKPADARSICIPLYQEFKELFCRTFSEKENESLLRHLEIYAVEKKWKKLLCACQQSVDYVIQRAPSSCGSKRKRPLTEVLHEWGTFSLRLKAAQKQIGTSSGVYFKFVEGAFITALRNGYWILLDEINLAPPETLQRITGVLDSEKGTLCLAERGDIDYIDRHPSFRLFACMNPATDTGKRELPYSLRSRFTEYFVDDILDENDLTLFVRRYMDEMDPDSGFSNRIVHFYKAAKRESEERLQDGANQKPQFSLRSLARALEYFKTAAKTFGIQKALYDGFCMFFLTLLDCPSAKVMHSMIVSYILGGSLPKDVPFDAYFSSSVGFLDDYVLTRSVKENLKNIARAVYIKKFPVLLQGPTSSGKTSLVHYLASVTGHEFVRINNHEHTDLQEYFGTYITDSQGRLLFQEGVLVKAVRLGYWIVLDELNLAPSDVLEALNRLLDDNRELFIPELQETIRAHPNFMLFATQNPPTLYGGRKMLSRAFRNRFLEIHVDEIPEDELSMILELRCKIPPSYASKMVEVMKELQLHRQHSKIFAGKHGFITPRDLFRWANRFRMFGMSYEDLAKDGYFLLAERLRDENEKVVVREALERHLRVKLNVDNLYMEANQDQSSLKSIEQNCSNQNFGNITWTNSMKRLFFLVERCYRLREPVLLIGETGGGKTTVCQLLSVYLKEKLHILNCHQYTETSDFIGGFYPVRDRSKMSNLFIQLIEQINASRFFNFFSREELSTDITKASSTITILNELVNTYKQNIPLHTVISQQDLKVFQQLNSDLIHLHQKWQTIFLWQDGPLVQAMKNGDLFLVDEISLADDSVLERLNSVLEPERKLSLAEKGGAILEQITAHPNFFLLATMNPGGDYGKKELSPALRNRFTEIWVPPVSDMNEFRSIAQERFINPDLSPFANHMLNFWEWFNMLQIGRSLTLRDLLSWVSFVNVTERDLGSICAFLHGSFLVLLDGLSLGTSAFYILYLLLGLQLFEHKKRNLELTFSSTTTIAALKCSTASCCTFCLEDLCQQSDFEEWLLTVSLCDVTSFLFDLELLSKFSKCMLADTSELHEGLLNLSDSLVHSVEYALNFSSRPPMDFTSHQTILWILDAWKTFDSVNAELSMTVIDMWFKFHSFLWGLCSKTNLMMKLDFEEICLVLPSRTAIIDKILQSNFSIVDYDIQCLKLSTTSRNLWQATLSQGEIVWFLHSAADSLFKQIIFVHYKYFTEDVFCKIRSFLCSAFGNSTLEDILNLKILISSSNHVGLCSVVDLLVEPILRELYMKHPSSDYLYNLGCAWLHIGMLRFYLLNQDGPDPALEFSFKHSNMLRKISLFDLETKVRQECQLLSGKDLVLYNEDQRLLTSQKLKEEEKQLRAKVVFRPSCSEYSHLRSECFDYGKLCSSLIEDLKNMGNISSMVLCNWQATSSKFINRLSEKYANYADLVQPVLVAVYEMKLGVSLVSSSALQKDYLEKVGGDDIQKIKAEVYSFMQFPRSLLYDSIPVNLKNYEQDSVDKFVYASATTNLWSIELMKKLINYSSETNLEKKVSPVPLDNILHYVMLIQTTDHVLYSHILDKDCFLVLNCTFDRFAKLWIDMKTQLKAKEDEDQTFKFRTRLIKIEDIMEEEELSDNAMDFDERLLSETSKNEQEFNEMMRPVEEDKKIEEEWELIHETFSKSLVRIHSLLYGSIGIVENPSARFVARDDRLISFLQSYKLGTRIIKDIDAFTPLSDDQLMPEYLFRVCLEYEEKFGIACKPPRAYNIYKDSNSIVLHKMTKPLGAIHKRVELFLVEWPDHPGLQNLGNIIEKLLSAPLSTPVSKALLGLQILVRKAKFLQENASMFSFKDLLDPIYSLISSWQKLELDSWKTLLDDVEEQFEINAAKLWFPLYAVLHRGTSYDAEADKLFTIQSIEEFVKSSNVGEFKKRLDLLFSFQGQLNHGVVLNAYSSSTMRENVNVLYNAFGYYVQFLPIVVDYIETERKSIEKDLREQLKLFSWERSHDLSIESFSRMRQKIRKLVQKYNEVLQQPLMLVVHQEAISKREKIPAWLESWTSDETNVDVLQCPLSVIKSNNVKRFFWFTSWMDKANMLTKNDILCAQGLSDVKHTLTSPTSFNELEKSWEESWFSIENISRKAAQFAHIWRHGTKNLTKRRMLGNLLKVLEKSGLSRHRHISDELGISMYSHPSYNVLHLLLLGDLHKSSRNISTSNQVQSDNRGDDIFGFKLKSTNITSQDNKGDDIIGSKWKFANELYFKNLAVMNQLQEVCLNFSKDFSKEQVDQTNSFLCQLVFIQQEQRDAMYSAYEHLKKLQLKLRWMNAGEQSEDLTIAMNQSALLMLMWKQKNVFDSLLAMSRETNMLLGSFKSCHLDTCKVIEDEVDRIYSVIDMFLPRFSKSKESLDMYLLCNDSIVSAATELPFLITKKMEDLVISNSEIINAFEESILVFSFDKAFPRSIGGTLLSRFEQIIPKGKMKVLISQIDKDKQCATRENSMNLETFYTESYERTIKLLLDVYDKLYTNSVYNIPVHDLSGQIALWNQLFQSHKKVLRLEEIDDAFGETISAARKFVDSFSDRKDEVCSQMQIQLKHLYVLLDLILTFGDGILFEFLDVHAAVAELTNVLAHIFILIFSKGFGSSQEETENSKCNGTEDASGTGMGEGEGVNDVSDQIEDEAQLLGTSEKHDGQDELEKQPNGNDKGIEMEEDFDGETFSVSEDSEDDDLEDEEDPNLDSQMGQTAEGDQKVDEKQWDGDEDDNTENRSEKYEPGPAVKEKDSGSRELTAKDDNALAADDLEDIDKNQDDRLNEEDNDSKKNEDDFNSDDMVVDKSKAFEDPTDIQIEEEAKQTEDADMDEPQGSDMDESELGSFGSDEEMNDVDDKSKEDNVVDEDVSQVDNNSRIEVEEKAETANMEPESNKETLPSDTTETFEYPLEGKESIKSSGNSHRIESLMVSDMLAADNNDINSSIAPSRSLLSDEMSKIEIASNSVDNSKISYDQFQLKPENSQDSCSRTRPNPYRSLGDAMEDWKERAKVSVDPLESLPELVENLANEDAEEYEFVADAEKSTSQALAAATSDQINNNLDNSKSSADENHRRKNEDTNQNRVKENSDTSYLNPRQDLVSKKKDDELPYMDIGNDSLMTEMGQISNLNNQYESVVSFKSSYMNEKELLLNTSTDDKAFSNSLGIEDMPEGLLQDTVLEWKKYEVSTTRLSQVLAEQLRLVMEPTLASKLQGDYKTGKRINMKKVIPYIASHFRKDKIWLRRTKPNKRNYQVVVAVDDSRSMSESNCGNAAIEALITVCRAMSQLEVGQFAVASFGRKGNVRLLHDFDEPFTGEAGVKIMSNLSFKQDNAIVDEPLADLLKYLNNMLDNAVFRARMPSGQTPLNQLVLIIADGRIHEKENLKRYVRDALNKKRLIALILLDSPEESIIDLMEASYEGDCLSFKKYLNTFPFPYYIIHRNIEALPQTLADLLRQWFELMQNAME
ncbi:midasin-like [Zingiber officinale]|uniref:midasin-like n=1 Tax=Zingiber officinale TaxID=94328 RepID=UPI001C4B0612|nr:midasin-like [Zingiber officinale]